jgi:hypothetical protein
MSIHICHESGILCPDDHATDQVGVIRHFCRQFLTHAMHLIHLSKKKKKRKKKVSDEKTKQKFTD